MKKILFNSLTCSALLFSSLFITACGGSDSDKTGENGIPETLSIPVTDNQFTGPLAGVIEIVDKDLNFKFEKREENPFESDPGYSVTVPVTIKVTGECKLLQLGRIPIDLLDANGAVVKTIMLSAWGDGYEAVSKIDNDIKNGITGTAYKAEIKENLSTEEAQQLAKEIKSAKGGLIEADVPGQKLASGGLYVENASFSGPFGDVIKIKDATYSLKVKDSVFKGQQSVSIKVDIEVLKQSSANLDGLYLNLVNESGTTIASIHEFAPTALKEMIKNGDVGKSYLMEFTSLIDDDDAERAKEEAVAISAGATKSK